MKSYLTVPIVKPKIFNNLFFFFNNELNISFHAVFMNTELTPPEYNLYLKMPCTIEIEKQLVFFS